MTWRGADRGTDSLWAPAPMALPACPNSTTALLECPGTGRRAAPRGLDPRRRTGGGGLSVFFFKHFSHLFGGEASFLPSSGTCTNRQGNFVPFLCLKFLYQLWPD